MTNSGIITATGGASNSGNAGVGYALYGNTSIDGVFNSGFITATGGESVDGEGGNADALESNLIQNVTNSGTIRATGGDSTSEVAGTAYTVYSNTNLINLNNSGDIIAIGGSTDTGAGGGGAQAVYADEISGLTNSGNITATGGNANTGGGGPAYGVYGFTSIAGLSNQGGTIQAVGGSGPMSTVGPFEAGQAYGVYTGTLTALNNTGGRISAVSNLGGNAYGLTVESALGGTISGTVTAVANNGGSGMGGSAFGLTSIADILPDLTVSGIVRGTGGVGATGSGFGVGIIGDGIERITVATGGSVEGSTHGIYAGTWDATNQTLDLNAASTADVQIVNNGSISGSEASIALGGSGRFTLDLINGSIDGDLMFDKTSSRINVTGGHTLNADFVDTSSAARSIDELYIQDGGILQNGSGNTWEFRDMFIGNSGNGTLNFSNGTLTSETATIAASNGSVGVINLTGAGTTWTNNGLLSVDTGGTGTVNISNGAQATTSYASLATNLDVSGTVNVIGAGSSWTTDNELIVGDIGPGFVNVLQGATATADSTEIGVDASAAGSVVVDGAGSVFTTDDLYVGVFGAGSMTASGGGAIVSDDTFVASRAGSTGTVLVTGNGSTWTNARDLSVGRRGAGTLTIADGGVVTVNSVNGGLGVVTLAYNPGASGTLTIGQGGPAGTLVATEVRVGVGDPEGLGNAPRTATVNFNQSDSAYVFAPKLTGALDVNSFGTGNTILTGAAAYTGLTSIGTGTLTFATTTSALTTSVVLSNNGTLAFAQNANDSFSGSVTGNGGVAQRGSALLTLNGALSYSGQTTVNAGGSLLFASSTANITGNVVNNGVVTFGFAPDNSFGGGLGGSGVYFKDLPNNLTVNGPLSFSGTFNANAGTLTIKGDTSAVTGNLVDNASVVFEQSADTSWQGVVTGTGSLTKNGANTLTFAGANSYQGLTTINAGTLVLSGDTSLLGGAIVNGSALVLSPSIDTSFKQVISGSGTLLKSGTGNTLLSAANTYSGTTTVTGGTLTFGGSTSALTGSLTNNATVAFAQSADSSFGNAISGTGSIVQNGTANLTLSGPLSYGGTTTVNSGTLTLASSTSGLTGNAVVNSGLVFAQSTDSSFAGGISGSGNLTQSGSGNLTIAGPVSYTGTTRVTSGVLTFSGTTNGLTGPVENATSVVFNQSQDSSLPGVISGAGSVTKLGVGNQVLGGNNTYAGLTTVNGGTLTFAGSTDLLTGNAVTNSLLAFAQSSNSVYRGAISGVGGLAQNGSATLNLTGPLSYTGTTTVNSGTLRISTSIANLSGGFVTNANLAFNLPSDTVYAGVIRGTGGITKEGANNLVLSSKQEYTGLTTIDAGTLTYVGDPSVLGPIVNRSELVFNPVVDGTFNGSITGPGNVTKEGASRLIFSGSHSVGNMNVNNGTFWVQNQLIANPVTVAAGATLGGIGNIVGNVNNFGTLAPGNSPGILRVEGNYVQAPGAAFDLEVESNRSFDRLVVSGTASISGTLNIIPFGGFKGLSLGEQIPFLTATEGVSGDFTTINGTFAGPGLEGDLVLIGGTLVLVVSSDDYTTLSEYINLTPNQQSVANGLDSFLGSSDPDEIAITSAIALLTPEEYAAAFDAISPAQYESLANMTIEQNNAMNQVMQQRFGSIRWGGGRGFSQQGLNYPLLTDKGKAHNGKDLEEGKDILAPGADPRWGMWAQGNGLFGRSYNIANVPSYNFDSGGFNCGIDYALNDHFVLGAYAGYQGSYTKYANGGRMDVNTVNYGLYATYQEGKGFYANAVIGGGGSSYDVKRQIEFGSVNRSAYSNPLGANLTTSLEFGYDIPIGDFTLTPTLGGQYTYVGIAPFTENGADSLDLSVDQQNANSLRTSLGARLAYTWKASEKITVIPQVSMLWQHEFLQNSRNIESTLDGGAGASFGYTTTVPARDAVFAGAGVTMQIGDRWNVNANWNIDFGRNDYISNMISGGVNVAF